MRLRNQLLALFCLVAFAGMGVVYFRTWVVQKPFAVILFVGDGLVTNTLTAARLYEGGADHRLTIESLPHVALLSNHANDFAVPDDAAAATALATGQKVNNRSLSADANGNPLRSILELAKREGRSVGVVTNSTLTSPTIAAFYAHSSDFRNTAAIAAQLLQSVDLAFGGGAGDFLPPEKSGTREDGRDLLADAEQSGCEVVRTHAELEELIPTGGNRVAGFFSGDRLAFIDEAETRAQQPALTDLVRRAIQLLQYNRAGYVLVVDAGLISRAAEKNEGERAIAATVELDHALATAIRYAGDDALIIATGTHATGGMTLNGFPLREEHGVALLGTTAGGSPSITWSIGPGGVPAPSPTDSEGGLLETGVPSNGSPTVDPAKNEPAAFYARSAISSATDVLAVGIGRGSERLKGFMDNTQIFEILRESL